MRPFINADQTRTEIARPRPVPPYLRVVDASACVKALKMVANLSSGMPIPVSLTEKRSVTVMCGFRFAIHVQDNFALISEFDGVADQIEDQLAQSCRITNQRVGHVRVDATG